MQKVMVKITMLDFSTVYEGREVASLISEGYTLLSFWNSEQRSETLLTHPNGNTVRIYGSRYGYTVFKNSREVKRVILSANRQLTTPSRKKTRSDAPLG